MYGYKIKFEGYPKTVIACETKVRDYCWRNTHTSDMLEISISRTDYIARYENGRLSEYENIHAISCKTAEEDCYSYSNPETEVEITSVIVTFDKLLVEKKQLTTEDADDKNTILLPCFLTNATAEQLSEISILMHRYIHYNSSDTAEYRLMKHSVFFEMLGRLDSYVRASISPDPEKLYKHNQYYIKKINSIINKKYSTKISASEIASELGISTVYLSSMYKKSTGITISGYILMTRMKKAEELLTGSNISTAEIAAMVGYENESSFRKRFREYFGMNVKEYRIIKRGNALYHNKPVRNREN